MYKYNKIIIRLSLKEDYTQTYDLIFNLVASSFLPKWVNRYLHCKQRQDSISEPQAFYNLNNDWSNQRIVEEINTSIDFCNQYERIFDRHLASIEDQDTLNYIHSVFELRHGQLDMWKNDLLVNKFPELRKALSSINQAVHRAESHGRNPRIRCVWFDLPKTEKFTSEDYKLFTNQVDFGGIYTLYADVGKNLESLSTDNDTHHHDFVPNLHYSVDFVVNFYETSGIQEQKIHKEYLLNNLEYFKNIGYTAEDPRLTTGRIKLAQLEYKDKQTVLTNIANHNNIQDVILL